jgi:hypothetical protein
MKLLRKWRAEGIAHEERRVELSQATLHEARQYGAMVPIVVWPDGRVEQGFEENIGCFIESPPRSPFAMASKRLRRKEGCRI